MDVFRGGIRGLDHLEVDKLRRETVSNNSRVVTKWSRLYREVQRPHPFEFFKISQDQEGCTIAWRRSYMHHWNDGVERSIPSVRSIVEGGE
jgi:hypothetical protein